MIYCAMIMTRWQLAAMITALVGVASGSCWIAPDTEGRVVINASVTEIPRRAFKECEPLVVLDLSGAHALRSIDYEAFRNCTGLVAVDFGGVAALETIGENAFKYCTALLAIDLSGSQVLRDIGEDAFKYCHSLAEANLGDGAATLNVGEDAFKYCRALQTAIIPASAVLGEGAFDEAGCLADHFCAGASFTDCLPRPECVLRKIEETESAIEVWVFLQVILPLMVLTVALAYACTHRNCVPRFSSSTISWAAVDKAMERLNWSGCGDDTVGRAIYISLKETCGGVGTCLCRLCFSVDRERNEVLWFHVCHHIHVEGVSDKQSNAGGEEEEERGSFTCSDRQYHWFVTGVALRAFDVMTDVAFNYINL